MLFRGKIQKDLRPLKPLQMLKVSCYYTDKINHNIMKGTIIWSAIRLMKLVLDPDGPSVFDSSSGVSV
jgi:hypothetical protein